MYYIDVKETPCLTILAKALYAEKQRTIIKLYYSQTRPDVKFTDTIQG